MISAIIFLSGLIIGIIGGYFYKRWEMEEIRNGGKGECPFGTPCLKFNEEKTKEAMNRVVKLILDSTLAESEYREGLRKLVKKMVEEI